MTDQTTEIEDERDKYDELLAALGRSFDDDVRIAIHEAGHAVAARLLGHPLGGATVDPGPGFEGRVWGERHMEAFTDGRGDASDVRAVLAPVMPKAGEDRRPVADVFGNVYAQTIELMAGRAAERMLSTVLRIKRTLDGAEIDKIIRDVEAGKELAIERRRRADWRTREMAAESFLAENDHADGASLPHRVQDRRD